MAAYTSEPVLYEVACERDRQNELKAAGRFKHTLDDAELTDDRRFVILSEEVGEVARAIQDGNRANLREELIQVAALAVAFVEGIDVHG